MSNNLNPRRRDGRGTTVKETAATRLKSCPYPSIQRLRCDFKEGRLTLRGRVATFFEKQVAQETVGGLDGVRELVNRIEVS